LEAFQLELKETDPDFQRSAGEYDAWFIRRAEDGRYLRGFEYWDEVEGALVRFFITDIMHWLGLVELGAGRRGAAWMAFRRIPSADLALTSENGRLKIFSDGRVAAPRSLPRAARYQLGRFCEWEAVRGEEFRYRVTARSLSRAKGAGLKASQLLQLLERHAQAGIPPPLRLAIERWDDRGLEAQIEAAVVLRVRSAEILERLRSTPVRRFLGQSLGPRAIMISGGARSRVMSALAELGVLASDTGASTEAAEPPAAPPQDGRPKRSPRSG
jgi:hypothetical protein